MAAPLRALGRARFWLATHPAGVIAVALALLALAAAGVLRLRDETPRPEEPRPVGFVPPVRAEPSRGFAVGVAVEVRGCARPVRSTVVAAGTAEFWIDARERLGRRPMFRLVLPVERPRGLRVAAEGAASDVVDPLDAARRPPAAPVARSAIEDLQVGAVRGGTLVSGRVRDWGATLVPIRATYETDAPSRRGLGSCFVALPAVTGELSALAGQQARGRADRPENILSGPDDLVTSSERTGQAAIYRPDFEPVRGAVSVAFADGSISGDDSIPGPDASVDGVATWTCASAPLTSRAVANASPRRPPRLLLGSPDTFSAGALSVEALGAQVGGDCSALAVLVEADAGRSRDLLLLIVGGLVGLAMSLLVDSVLLAPRRGA